MGQPLQPRTGEALRVVKGPWEGLGAPPGVITVEEGLIFTTGNQRVRPYPIQPCQTKEKRGNRSPCAPKREPYPPRFPKGVTPPSLRLEESYLGTRPGAQRTHPPPAPIPRAPPTGISICCSTAEAPQRITPVQSRAVRAPRPQRGRATRVAATFLAGPCRS